MMVNAGVFAKRIVGSLKPTVYSTRTISTRALSVSKARSLYTPIFLSLRSYASFPSHEKISMPALSPTMTHGNLVKWSVEVGTQLEAGDVLNEIETDKATMEFEASEDGYLAKILVSEGEKDVPVGKTLCIMVENEADIAAFENYTESDAPAEGPAEKPKEETPAPAPEPTAPAASPTPPAPTPTATETPSTPAPANKSGEVFASPFAKKMASSMGIDLATVQGSGPNGRVVENDLLNLAKSGTVTAIPAATGAPAPTGTGPATDHDLSNVRKIIASRLLESKTTIPHYYLTSEVNLDALKKVRTTFNNKLENSGVKLSVNDFIIKASALACKDVPECNSSWQDTFIRQYNDVDVCVAVSTPNGLITPIVTGADSKGLKGISESVKDLASRARDSKLAPHEYQGGTFTVSNLGMFGVSSFSAIINPPQACILAVGGAEKKVLVGKDGEYYVGDTMKVTLSCDHRVVDGAVGAQWLQKFKAYIEDPMTMLL